MICIATFYSHFGAIRFRQDCRNRGVPARAMPVPRDLSSSCGTCVRFEGGCPAAVPEEVEQIVEAMEVSSQETKAQMTFKCGKLSGKDVVIVRSGIGKVNAAICTQILVDDYKVDYVINTGIAGATDRNIHIDPPFDSYINCLKLSS